MPTAADVDSEPACPGRRRDAPKDPGQKGQIRQIDGQGRINGGCILGSTFHRQGNLGGCQANARIFDSQVTLWQRDDAFLQLACNTQSMGRRRGFEVTGTGSSKKHDRRDILEIN